MLQITDLLELVGLVLLVAAAGLVAGTAGGLAVAGAGCLWVSWGLSRR